MAKENECCRFCGTEAKDVEHLYSTVSKEPWCDNIIFCEKCKKVLEKANWFKNRKIEVIK